jgi:hypothetical protein
MNFTAQGDGTAGATFAQAGKAIWRKPLGLSRDAKAAQITIPSIRRQLFRIGYWELQLPSAVILG